MKAVNQPIRKKDAMALVTGKPVFMDDLVPKDCLIVKLLRSPHANAIIKEINKTAAEKVPGIEAIYTWEDVPQQRFTTAGQTYPEATPYDRLILDRHVRFVGDPVAIIAGEDEACVEKAMRLIKVKYEVLPAILDFHVAKDNEILIHPEDNWRSLCPVGADNKRNLCATARSEEGDVDGVMAECDTIVEHTYHTVADQQCDIGRIPQIAYHLSQLCNTAGFAASLCAGTFRRTIFLLFFRIVSPPVLPSRIRISDSKKISGTVKLIFRALQSASSVFFLFQHNRINRMVAFLQNAYFIILVIALQEPVIDTPCSRHGQGHHADKCYCKFPLQRPVSHPSTSNLYPMPQMVLI